MFNQSTDKASARIMALYKEFQTFQQEFGTLCESVALIKEDYSASDSETLEQIALISGEVEQKANSFLKELRQIYVLANVQENEVKDPESYIRASDIEK